MKKGKRINIKGFSIMEVILWIAVFSLMVLTTSNSFNFSLSNYKEWILENINKNIVEDINAYLYAYKKAYGTIDFERYIASWYTDNVCEWSYFDKPYIKDYCIFFPYVSNDNLKFYKWDINDEEGKLNNIYLINNSSAWNDGDTYLKYFSYSKTEKTVIVALKKSNLDKDLFEGFIWIYDLLDNKYLIKENVYLK